MRDRRFDSTCDCIFDPITSQFGFENVVGSKILAIWHVILKDKRSFATEMATIWIENPKVYSKNAGYFSQEPNSCSEKMKIE